MLTRHHIKRKWEKNGQQQDFSEYEYVFELKITNEYIFGFVFIVEKRIMSDSCHFTLEILSSVIRKPCLYRKMAKITQYSFVFVFVFTNMNTNRNTNMYLYSYSFAIFNSNTYSYLYSFPVFGKTLVLTEIYNGFAKLIYVSTQMDIQQP